MTQDGMNLRNNILIICTELLDGTILVDTSETLEIDYENPLTLNYSMDDNDKIKIKEIRSSDEDIEDIESDENEENGDIEDDEGEDEELFDDSLDTDSYSSALPTDGIRDNESGSDKFGVKYTREKVEMHLADFGTPNDWYDVPPEAASGGSRGISQFSRVEKQEKRNIDLQEDENDNVSPYSYQTESESELEQLSYSDRSSLNTPVTSTMSGYSPVIKSSALILLKTRGKKIQREKKNSKKNTSVDPEPDKKGTLLSRVQLEEDMNDESNLTSATPQIDLTESDSPSPRKLSKSREVKSKRKESRTFISPIAVQRSSQFVSRASELSRRSHCCDRLGAGSTTATDSTESFKRNELAMSSNVTTPKEFIDHMVGDSDEAENETINVEDKTDAASRHESEADDEDDGDDEDIGTKDEFNETKNHLQSFTINKPIEKSENENLKFDLIHTENTNDNSNAFRSEKLRKLETIEENKSLETEKGTLKKEKKIVSSNKRCWADCARNNVHPSNKQEKATKDSNVPANPIKNFIALNKAQLHRGSKKTYTEIFLERKAKAEAKRREELAKMLGVKIPPNIAEEEKQVTSSPKKDFHDSGDVEINDGSMSPTVDGKFVESGDEGIAKKPFSNTDLHLEISATISDESKKSNDIIKISENESEEKVSVINEIKAAQEYEALETPKSNEKLIERSRIPKLTPTKSKSNTETSQSISKNTLIEDKELRIVDKSSSDNSVLKKTFETEKEQQISEELTKTEETVATDDVVSTLSSGFIASTAPDGLKIRIENAIDDGRVAEPGVVEAESKGKVGTDLIEAKTERINRSKKKKKSSRQKSIEHEEDSPTTPRNKSKRSSSLPPLKGEETNHNIDGANNNNYKPYTLKDYRQLQLDIQLGGLGPNSDRNVLQEKLQKYQRQANYAQQVMERNRKLLETRIEKSKTTFAQVMQEAIDPSKDTRQRALDYAKNIRKPPSKLEKEENVTSNKPNSTSKQVKLPPLKPANSDRWQAEGTAKGGRLETVIEEEAAGVATPVKTRPFAMDSLMENVEKLKERHAKEREIVEQLFINRNQSKKEPKDDKPKKKNSKKK